MSTALANEDSDDVCPADRTGFPCPVIYPEIVLKLTAAVDPIDRRAIAANALLQNPADRFVQRLSLFYRDGIGGSQRVQLRKMQRFICVNVAKPGEEGLVEQ